jgi:hypothetical protein
MIGRRRGQALLTGAAVLAVLLVTGRWLAVETTEHAWAATVLSGPVYLDARSLARLLHWLVLVVAALWGTGNLYIVYRAIGSVQMPRRVGNLEIVEAVPQRLLLLLAIATGLVFGLGLAWGTDDWWREALLASAAPTFGRLDPILNYDVGYYVGQLPWAVERQQFLLLATLTASVLSGFLYLGIGSLRWQRGRFVASPHARVHLGMLSGGMAVAVLWGALLDPAEVVAGQHGVLTAGLLSFRLRGSVVVAVAAGMAAFVSVAWVWWDRVRWMAVGWGTLAAAMLAVYGILPAVARRGSAELYPRERAQFTALAFGAGPRLLPDAPQFPSMAAFVAAQPLWSPAWVAAAARPRVGPGETVAGVTLARQGDGAPLWIVARAPDDTALLSAEPPLSWDQVHRGQRTMTGVPLALAETDTGLVPAPLELVDSTAWFGEGFSQYAVTNGTGPSSAGIPLTGTWRRLALAWVLQSPEIARRTAGSERLLWRRTAGERFARLVPFAEFSSPEPVVADGVLWWRAIGYVTAESFPLVAPVQTPQGPVRFLRAGIMGAVRASSGETRFWLLPGADSVTVAWARLFAPLVAPADSAPPVLTRSLRYPTASFALAMQRVVSAAPDSSNWQTLPREPSDLLLPAEPAPWLVQGFTSEEGGNTRLEGLLLGHYGAAGPELWSAVAPSPDPPPQLLVGSGDTTPGPLRLWLAAGHLASSQARFIRHGSGSPQLEHVFLTWGNRAGEGGSVTAALRELTLAGPPGAVDTSLAARWVQAQRLFTALDSALVARNFERFGQVYRQLGDLLGARRRALAPTPPLH